MGVSAGFVLLFLTAGTFSSFSGGLSFFILLISLDFLCSVNVSMNDFIFFAGIFLEESKLAFVRDLFVGFVLWGYTIIAFSSRVGEPSLLANVAFFTAVLFSRLIPFFTGDVALELRLEVLIAVGGVTGLKFAGSILVLVLVVFFLLNMILFAFVRINCAQDVTYS